MSDKPKMGEGHASAMWRQGLRELRNVFYPESNVSQQLEYGLYGTRTPGEVAEARNSDTRDLEDERRAESILDRKLRELDQRHQEPGKERPGPEMDR
jgi:hypothetical protein